MILEEFCEEFSSSLMFPFFLKKNEQRDWLIVSQPTLPQLMNSCETR